MSADKICVYNIPPSLPPCIQINLESYNYLEDLLFHKPKSKDQRMIFHLIDCMQLTNNSQSVDITNDKCISCMFCVFGCPGNQVQIHNNHVLKALCSEAKLTKRSTIHNLEDFNPFSGSLVSMPETGLSHLNIKFDSFEDFTSINETTNISIWGANCLKFLSRSSNPSLGLEINMKIKSRKRGGRLDISMLNDELLIVAEAKVSFRSMIDEKRYLAQMISYEEEINNTIKNSGLDIMHHKFLLIGGDEVSLLPPNHPDCANLGNESTVFYNNCINHNIFFISANALLCLGLMKIKFGEKYSIENLVDIIFDKRNIGLISSGLVQRDYTIAPLTI